MILTRFYVKLYVFTWFRRISRFFRILQGFRRPTDVLSMCRWADIILVILKVGGCLILLFKSCLFSLGTSLRESGGASTSCSNSIFAAWDFCITHENTAKAKTQTIAQNFRVSSSRIT